MNMEERARQGQYLKQVRESKGIALETVHEATKIPLDALRAIEEGYTIRTMTPFYYRGFVKIYATYLGVDLKKVIDDYQPEHLPETIAEREGYGNTFEENNFLMEKLDSVLSPDVMRVFVQVLTVVILVVLCFKVGGCLIKKAFPPKTGQQIQEKPSIKDEKASVAPVSPAVPVAVTEQNVSRPSSLQEGVRSQDAVRVTVRAQKPSWLRVEADDAVVFQSTLKRGMVETWSASDKIVLSGKNISDLEFELNGKVIGTLGRKDRRAKKIIFTQNGFSVKQ